MKKGPLSLLFSPFLFVLLASAQFIPHTTISKLKLLPFALLLITQGLFLNAQGTIHYVKADAIGTSDGTSWANAYTGLQAAIDAANTGDEIWVAAGTYLPTGYPDPNNTTDPRDRSFHLDTDIKIYGGFDGTEATLSDRDPAANLTILSGDFDSDDDFNSGNGGYLNNTGDDNAYHVFITVNLSSAAVLNGFRIQGGNGNGSGSINYVGQLFVHIQGGGMYNRGSSPTIKGCIFSGNSAANNGGGVSNRGSSPKLTGCIFSGNTAGGSGGGISNSFSSSPTVTNSVFLENTASGNGGGMYNFFSSSPTVTNSTLTGNTASGNGGGMYNSSSSPVIANSIFWDNGSEIINDSSTPTVTFSIVQGGYADGTDIYDQDPLFIDETNGDLRLQAGSPGIDAGDNASYDTAAGTAPSNDTDLDGNARLVGSIIDLGAYENDGASMATCSDGIQNGDETGVDCGGSNCPPCASTYTDYCQLGLDIDGEEGLERTGESVSLSSDGSVLAIGAPYNDGNGVNSGRVHVYEWNGATWAQRGNDINGEAAGDLFGSSVSLSSDGSVLAIGAAEIINDGDNYVRVYEWNGTGWAQRGDDIDGEAAFDNSGSSVSLSSDGSVLAIGAWGNDGNGSGSGHVRVYEWDGTAWSQRGVDIDGEAAGDLSGESVSLSSDGSVLAIGASSNDGNGGSSGHVRVYKWTGVSWSQRGVDIDGEASLDNSGWSVSLSSDGSLLAVGAPYNNGNGLHSGRVRVYQWDGTGWSQRGGDIDGEASGDNSGWSVSLSSDGSELAIGAINNDGNGSNSGHVRVYEWTGTVWEQRGGDIDGEAKFDEFGSSVSLSSDGSFLAIGAPKNDGIPGAGHVRVYETCVSICNISAIAVSNLSSCTPGTNTFTADVTVSFQGAPAMGTLELSGIGSASVVTGALDSPTSHVFVGVEMPADGGAIGLTASFSNSPSCVFSESNAGTSPVSCATTCSDGIQNGDEEGIDCGGTACTPCITFYADSDADMYGDVNTSILAATAPAGYVTDNTDCDDTDALEYPGQSWYVDADGDGYSAGAAIQQCERPTDGYVLSELAGTNDCDDADPDEFPGQTWYIDADGDQYSAGATIVQCERPTNGNTGSRSTGSSGNSNNDAIGFLLSELAGTNDCNDSDALEYPGQQWYVDEDGDGYSAGAAIEQCERPMSGYVLTELTGTDDCDDTDALEYPGQQWYLDSDGDGYSVGTAIEQCERPTSGYVLTELSGTDDCNDSDGLEYPGQQWYVDEDGDGYSAGAAIEQCERPLNGYILSELNGTDDCDDTDANANIGQTCSSICSDGIQNGDETGVDCGGSNCPPCTPTYTDYCQLGLDIDGEAAGDNSGYSVSLSSDGSVLAIGAFDNDGNGSNSGHVRVYEWTGVSWAQRGVDIDGEAADDKSGISVSLSSDGNLLAIGANGNDGNGSNSGHVRVYEWTGIAWSQRGVDIDGEAAGDNSGNSVSLSSDGSVLAIGASGNSGNGGSSGHVRVYEWTGVSWAQRGVDIDGEAAGNRSGISVSLSSDGSMLAIGADLNDDNGSNSGHVRVYEWDGMGWSQRGVDIDGEVAADQSGSSVSLSSDGSVLAISALFNDGNGSNSGHVRVYEWDGMGWSQRGVDIDGEAADDRSGISISLNSDGSLLAIGASNNDGNGSNSGHVRVYEWTGTVWSQRGVDIDGEAAFDYSGGSVSLSSDGSLLAIGAYGNDGNGDGPGHVRVYEACVSTCEISAIAVSNLSSCTPGTDTYTADVTVSFQSAPATGTLELSGSGNASVSVGALDSPTSHVFTGLEMPADGEAIDLSATFTDATSCVFTESNAGTAPASCALTCSDGIQNGDETGVDCGGSNCPPCSLPCLSDPAFNQVIISEDLLFPTTVQGADFNEDGHDDVLVSYYGESHLAWHENNGDGTFGTIHTVLLGAVPYFAHAADLDGDLDADIICTFDSPGGGTYWFENLGSGSFSSFKTINSSSTAWMIQTADLDEDDVPDVVFPVIGTNEIRWHKNFGTGSISTNENIVSSVAGQVASVFPADLDGDGDTDILAGSLSAQNDNNLVWFENFGFGSFDPTPKVIQSISSVGSSISVFSIDLDNDSDVDVIYGHAGIVAWHENLGNGTFGSQQVLNNNPGTVEFVYAEDLTGDGLPDVFSASEYNISWYKNLGSGSFSAPEAIHTITSSSGNNFDLSHLDVADVNGDGYFDLLSATTVDHTVAWYDNDCIVTPDCPSPDAFNITTIQAAPALVLDEDGEWFRVYNTTDTDYDLQGYTIKDDGTDSHTITTSLLLPAGGSITLGNNADTLTNGGVHVDYAYGSDITLDDEEDEIVLICNATEVARAEYSGGLFAGCTNPTVALGADGTVSITPAQVEDGTMALDGLAGLWLDVTDFDCSHQGQDNPVELTVVDTDGDTSTCMANITVIDNMAPTAVCTDVTITLDSAGMALLVADSLDGGSTDNCATAFTYEASQVTFSCEDLGEQSVTLTVSDGSPDAASGNCTGTVTIVDDAAPVAECQDAAVQLDTAGMAMLNPEDVDNGSYDNCTPAADLDLELSQSQFDCADLGEQMVSLIVNDGSPNSGSGSCMAMVTVEDLLPPQAECVNTVVQLDENGTAFLPAFNVDGGSSDNCGTLDLALSQSSFDCTHLGENAVDMIVSDGSNNKDSCTATITVKDLLLPVAVCQPFSVSLDSTGSASITADSVDGGSTDNCAGVSLMLNQSTFDCGDIGTNTVTLTAIDASNNSDACQATVTVTDDLPPQALCTDISVALDSLGQAMITTDLIGGASTDNCGAPVLSLSQADFDCSHIGTNPVVLTATDGSNNTDTCTAIVTVQDLMAPEAVCMAVTVQLDTMGAATLSAAAVGSNSTDNCVSVDLQLDESSFDCSQLGVNTVTLTVMDGSNNTDTCTVDITVEDLVPPTASCEPMLVLELDPSGQASLSATEVDAGSFDNCTVADLSVDQTEFFCTDLGMQTVELTVTDNSGNMSTCTTGVQITDVSKPFALCQDIEADLGPDGTLTLDGSSLDGGSLDNCGVATLTPNPAQLNCADIGFNTVILTVADASGNFSTCVSSVSLADNTPPNAVCVPSLTIEVEPESASPAIISATDLDSGSTDNCDIAQLQVDPFAFTCSDIGAANPVTLTVIDENGLESSCTSMVTVVNALEGQACDDGDDCTENDTYDANCNCAGTLIDEDNNGVCDLNECTSPINLQASNITANTADLSWTAVAPAVEYLVRYRINGGGALNALATSESITLTGLPGSAQIEWRVRAICNGGQSSFSTGDAFMTLENTCPDADGDGVCDESDLCPEIDDALIGQPCDDDDPCTINDTYGSDCVCRGALFDENNNDICDLNETGCTKPENLQVPSITPDMATLTWNAVIGADSYRVGYITPGQSGTVMIVNTNMVTLTGLSPESEYFWQVRANCDMTNSDNNNGPAFTTSATGCPDADGDEVCDGDDQCPDFDDMLIGTSCNDYDNCTVNDVVTADCECAGTLIDNNNDGVCDLDELCAPPSNLVTNALSPTSGTVAWDPVPGAVAYQLQYLIAGFGMGNTQLSDTIYTFEGLPPGSIIQWRVRTTCSSGKSSWEVGPALPLPNSLNGGGGVELRTGDGLPPVDWQQVSRELSELQFDVFPNPARDEASLVLSRQTEGTEAIVYNLWGQELARYSLDGIQVQMLNVAEWRAQNTAVVIVLFEPGQPPKTKKLLLVQ